jgi:hypothetical protein
MELRIRPTDLYAAGVALSSCSRQLEAAGLTFSRQALTDLPDVGASAAEAAQRGILEAGRAVDVISADVDRLAQALVDLAHFYPRLDSTAVPAR